MNLYMNVSVRIIFLMNIKYQIHGYIEILFLYRAKRFLWAILRRKKNELKLHIRREFFLMHLFAPSQRPHKKNVWLSINIGTSWLLWKSVIQQVWINIMILELGSIVFEWGNAVFRMKANLLDWIESTVLKIGQVVWRFCCGCPKGHTVKHVYLFYVLS